MHKTTNCCNQAILGNLHDMHVKYVNPWEENLGLKAKSSNTDFFYFFFSLLLMSQGLSFGIFSAHIGLFSVSITGESNYWISAVLSSEKDKDIKTVTLIKSWCVSSTFCHPTLEGFSFRQAAIVRASSTCRNTVHASGLEWFFFLR